MFAIDRHGPPVVSDAQARAFAATLAALRETFGGISSDRLRGKIVPSAIFREVLLRPLRRAFPTQALVHRTDILCLNETVDPVAGSGSRLLRHMLFRMGPIRRRIRGAFRRPGEIFARPLP